MFTALAIWATAAITRRQMQRSIDAAKELRREESAEQLRSKAGVFLHETFEVLQLASEAIRNGLYHPYPGGNVFVVTFASAVLMGSRLDRLAAMPRYDLPRNVIALLSDFELKARAFSQKMELAHHHSHGNPPVVAAHAAWDAANTFLRQMTDVHRSIETATDNG